MRLPGDENWPALPDGILLEGIVATVDADGALHIAPMGPIVDLSIERLLFRPFRTSVTYQNLVRTGRGVFHITDDVLLFARAAVGQLAELPSTERCKSFDGFILQDACRWYAFEVTSTIDIDERTAILVQVTDSGTLREFIGFNRAKHAVIEAAILATRLHLLDPGFVAAEYSRHATIVDKTGGHLEHTAFDFLRSHVEQKLSTRSPSKASN